MNQVVPVVLLFSRILLINQVEAVVTESDTSIGVLQRASNKVAVRVYSKGGGCTARVVNARLKPLFPENIVSYGCIEGRDSVRT